MDFSPKFNLIYYKNILDNVLMKFIKEFNDSFIKINESYVFSFQISRNNLKKKFKNWIHEEIKEITTKFSITSPNYYFIIGSCFPNDNVLLEYSDKQTYFPQKLKRILENNLNIKYTLKEKDIKIDIEEFNIIFEDIFNDFFRADSLKKELGKEYTNIFFIKHARIDCYMMYRIFKYLYGSINIINLHKKNIGRMKSNLNSINEKIDSYIKDIKGIVSSNDLNNIRMEINQFVNECIRKNFNGKK